MRYIKYFSRKSFLVFAILILFILQYMPLLTTGFLTDDFLDCNHSLSEVPAAFSSQSGGGYRPLMILSWALDNKIWSIENQAGWHATNLLLLLISSLLIFTLLGRFLKNSGAIYAGTVFFMFSFPMAVAVARVSWRTTILALIPFLASLILISIWSMNSKRKWLLYFAAFLYLISLLLKETTLAALPVMALVAYCSSSNELRWRNTVWSAVVGFIPLIIYGALRYRAMGFGVNYAESSYFGLFMVRNLLLQNSLVWSPWLTSIPARILFLLYPVAIYFGVPEWKNRILVFSFGFFLVLPVSNLVLRPDFSVAALPGAALFLGFVVQRLYGRRYLLSALVVVFAGIFLFSRDEIRILRMASDYVYKTTGRIADITDELPGSGPLFFSGIEKTFSTYGTFWPGEYMMPMQCMGIQTDRFVAGTSSIWEGLAKSRVTSGNLSRWPLDSRENGLGFLVFFADNGAGYFSSPLSIDMYAECPDTSVFLSGSITVGELVRYPSCSCTPRYQSGILYLVSPVYHDSVVAIYSEISNGQSVFDLAAVPEWLVSDQSSVLIVTEPLELVFSSRNISLEKALKAIELKQEESTI